MTLRLFLLLIIIHLGHGVSVNAADIPLEFEQPEQQQRYQDLLEKLRCLVCQNQSLSDSHADLAQDLRSEVYQMILDGKDDETITHFLVERYGNFILYQPPLNRSTWLLWFSPFILLAGIGIFIVIYIIKRPPVATQTLTQEEHSKLSTILREQQSLSTEE